MKTAIRFVTTLTTLFLVLWATGVAEQNVKKNFTVRPGGVLRLDVSGESVQITTSEKLEAIVEVEDIPDKYVNDLKISQSGNDVIVTFKPSRRRQEDTRFFITIPEEFNVDAKYTGGRFEVAELLKGYLTVFTDGGSVDLVDVTGVVNVESGGGSIEGRLLGSDVKIKTGGGSVQVREIGGSGQVKTGGGSVKLEKVAKDLTLETGGGNVRVGTVGGKANLETGGGNMQVGAVALEAKVRSGGGNLEIEGGRGRTAVKTGGGNVALSRLMGSVDVNTGGGSVTVDLTPEGTASSNVESKGGDITFRLPENAKATIEVTLNIRRYERKKYSVRSDFKPEKFEKDEDGNVSATYTLNGGGQKITLETTDGDIEVRRLTNTK